MTINYTTKAEYYLQKQNQITPIPTMEGKNTPLIKKTTERTQQGGAASAWEPPSAGQHVCLCSCHCSLFWRWKSICFSFFCKIHLDAVFWSVVRATAEVKFKPDLRFQKMRHRGNIWALTFKTALQRQNYSLTKSCFWLHMCKCEELHWCQTGRLSIYNLQLEQNRVSRAYEIMGVWNTLNFLGLESLKTKTSLLRLVK